NPLEVARRRLVHRHVEVRAGGRLSRDRCRRCRRELPEGARFCGRCGRPTEDVERAQLGELERRSAEERSSIVALAIVFVGSLFAILLPLPVESELVFRSVRLALLAVVACAASFCLGRNGWRLGWAGASEPRWMLLAVGLGCLSFGISYVYVQGLLFVLEEEGGAGGESIPLGLLLLDVVVLTAVIEEWLCRGVLWAALKRVADKALVIVFLSALLFALLHSFNGLFFFEWPHRFLLGGLCGWLRYRSGSLWPCILLHAVNNLLATLL
ncbi:MAG: CPBP family intramembrane glutamic endopeptidase, partial [Planctomycetota bacterium]